GRGYRGRIWIMLNRILLSAALAVAFSSVACCGSYMEAREPPRPPEAEIACETQAASPVCIQIDVEAPPPAVVPAAPLADRRACAPGRLQDCTAECGRGDAGSCVLLGVMYLRGQGVPPDQTAAADLFARACKADNLAGCNNLGIAFSEGQGRPRSYRHAVELFRQVCYG